MKEKVLYITAYVPHKAAAGEKKHNVDAELYC